MAKGPTKLMWKRMFALMLIVVVLGFGTASVRLVDLMLVQGGELSLKASNEQLSNTTIAAERGTIYDRNKNVLATSATVWTVYITPKDIETDEEAALIANGLSEILELDRDTSCSRSRLSATLLTRRSSSGWRKTWPMRCAPLSGTIRSARSSDWTKTTKRYYPNGSLASTVLGFVGDDNQGLYGIEYQYDTQLQGVPGKVVASKNARGSDMPFNYETMVEAQQGNSLVLTIDEYILVLRREIPRDRRSYPIVPIAAASSSWISRPAGFWPWRPSRILTPTNPLCSPMRRRRRASTPSMEKNAPSS